MTHAGAMTIDVEDYFHVHAFKDVIDRADWPSMTSRVEANTHRMLDLFEEAGAKATFFTLGCVAAQHSGLVRRIVDDGHELASHGWDHWAVFDQTREAFKADVVMARDVLEDIGSAPVKGYRAASFSIDARSPWAYDALERLGMLIPRRRIQSHTTRMATRTRIAPRIATQHPASLNFL